MPESLPNCNAERPLMSDSLYERDYYAWTREQCDRLRDAGRNGNAAPVDWERVAEEIEDLGDVRWDEVEALVGDLLIHVLKLAHCSELRESQGQAWWLAIRDQRRTISKRLKRSPSLRPMLDTEFHNLYAESREQAAAAVDCHIGDFPVNPTFTLVQVLSLDYLSELTPKPVPSSAPKQSPPRP